jgi:hypothetical protein
MTTVLVVEDEAAVTEPQKRVCKVGPRPDPSWVRGRCPVCGDELVSNLYYLGGKGYLLRWECWASLGDDPTCSYRKVL